MDLYLHLLYQLPAAFGLVAALRRLLPVELDDRLVPLFVVLCCLVVLYLPVTLALAFALAPVVGLLFKYTHTPLTGADPFVYPHVSLPGFLARFRHETEYVYQAEHVSGDLKDLQKAEEPKEETPSAQPAKAYVPDL